MSVILTTQTENGRDVIVGQDNTGATPDYVAIAIDYGDLYGNIANTLITISNDIKKIVDSSERIADATESIDSTMKLIATDVDRIRQLGDTGGEGFRTISPYGWIGNAALYQLYVEQGYAIDDANNISEADQDRAIEKLKSYRQKLGSRLES